MTPEPVTPEPVTPEPVTPEPVTPEPVTPEPVTPEPVTPGQVDLHGSEVDPATLRSALARATASLLGRQHPDGWWKAELETNVTMDAEDLLLRHFLGIGDARTATAAAGWILSQRRPDGTWATFFGGPPDLSTTVEAYVALRIAGHRPDDYHMAKAARWIRASGGMEGTRVFTRIWLAMVGVGRWADLPVLPPEVIFLPSWAPLNIYDFGCWARQTIVALTVIFAHRPARPLPFELSELAREGPAPQPSPLSGSGRGFMLLDRLLHRYQDLPGWVLPKRVLRAAALGAAESWIVHRQEADGGWGGIQPPLVYSVIALHLQGYPLDHPVMAAALAGMEAFILDDARGRRVEACQSPVWDTALSVVALSDAGIGPDHPAVGSARRWLLGKEVHSRGDWAQRRPRLEPGGWSFEFANVNYPDTDDTAEVVMALSRAGVAPGDAALRRGVNWTVGMQSRGGGWAAFDVDNTSALCASLPFCDFGEVTDPPSADVTAHVIEMLAEAPASPAIATALARGLTWLSEQQEADGSWYGRWGVNYLYGTGAALPALAAAGVKVSDPRMRRAVTWLEAHQNDDGGWGEDIRSYVDRDWRGRGPSCASQTSWALVALVAAGEASGEAAGRGIAYLIGTQREDGSWDEPYFTGTGFPWDFSINYHLYRLVWPVMAMGRAARARGGPSGLPGTPP
ncbi:MAG: squalene--hopene cyclase [Acidimicrobiales bacterium]